MLPGSNLAHTPGNTLQDIDCRVMILMPQLSVQHNMPVQDTARRIGNGFVEIISVHQHCVQPRDRSPGGTACTFQKLRHLGIYAGRITSGHGRFSSRQPYLPLRHGKTGQGIHHQQDIFSSIAKIFCNGGSRLGCLIPLQGRPVGRSHHHYRPPHSLFSQIPFYKFTHLAPAFPDQRNHVDIRLRISCEHTHQSGFSYTGTGKNADTLSFTHRNHPVHCFYSQREYFIYNLPA